MDSRVCTGRYASTSRLAGRSYSIHGHCSGTSGRVAAGSAGSDRSSGFTCRSTFDSASQGFPTCRFPTTEITGQDWRAFRAHLVAWEHSTRRAAEQSLRLQRPPYPPFVSGGNWAHPLAEPEQGCLLLSRKDNMDFFTGAVILLTSHADDVGSIGYVLNKPSPLKVDDLDVLGAASGFKEAFSGQRLHLGGPLHLDHVTLLHRCVGVSRCQKITDGMFMGGLADAIRLVNAGLLRPSDFHLVLGMSAWAAGQLADEIASGCWHVISASPELVFPTSSAEPPIFRPAPAPVAVPAAAAAASATAAASQQQLQQRPQLLQASGEGAARGQQAPGPGGGRRRSPGGGAHSAMYRRIARLAVRGAGGVNEC